MMDLESSSFRDPAGFIFRQQGILYRQVNLSYQVSFDYFLESGLYAELTAKKLLIEHQEVERPVAVPKIAYRTLQPELIPFISYPYEWSFAQLKDAALLTLQIEELALKYGMGLKDASAYNIQFLSGKPILIDTLSFEVYQEGAPWVAYRQFCQHFLAPLALMAHCDIHLGRLSWLDVDGVPLELASKLLPARTKLSVGLGAHIHLHAFSQRATSQSTTPSAGSLSKERLLGIIASLRSTVSQLQPIRQKTTWHGYYNDTNYTTAAATHKEQIITEWLEKLKPATVWDAGANDARFSRLASKRQIPTVATDIDPYAVQDAYQLQDPHLLPLVLDLVNPSPALGWANTERSAFLSRAQFEMTFCLAFVHHLALAYNIPLDHIAALFAKATRYLVIEFVLKEDSNAQRLLLHREDIFTEYTTSQFESVFAQHFTLREKIAIAGSVRTLYLFERS